MNLNGEWQFETDNDNDGRERELFADGVRLFGKRRQRSLLPPKAACRVESTPIS